MMKQPKKKTVKTDPSDLQAPIDVAPETALQVPEDPPKVVEEIPRKSPNGDPFDTMYRRQQKQ